jgi:hypothetical protein
MAEPEPPRDTVRPDPLGAFADQGPVTNAEQWTSQRAPSLRAAFQREIYGPIPAPTPVRVQERRIVDPDALGGRASLEEVTLATDTPARRMRVAMALPKGEGPHPVLLMLSFCGPGREFGRDDLSPPIGPLPELCARVPATGIIRGAPVERIIAQGFALVVMTPGDVVPDVAADARAALELFGDDTGAIAAWAWGVSRIIDHMETDARFDAGRIAVLGHSRKGKAALVAAAFDARIAAVIAHQSGTGGAAPSRHDIGETVASIVERYGYWFAPRLGAYADNEAALPIDQHQLLALVAPRPLLIGNGAEDEWADPDGTWRNVEAASAVYDLLGASGLAQATRETPNNHADLAYFLRPGGHGISPEDWERFLDFLGAHLDAP